MHIRMNMAVKWEKRIQTTCACTFFFSLFKLRCAYTEEKELTVFAMTHYKFSYSDCTLPQTAPASGKKILFLKIMLTLSSSFIHGDINHWKYNLTESFNWYAASKIGSMHKNMIKAPSFYINRRTESIS